MSPTIACAEERAHSSITNLMRRDSLGLIPTVGPVEIVVAAAYLPGAVVSYATSAVRSGVLGNMVSSAGMSIGSTIALSASFGTELTRIDVLASGFGGMIAGGAYGPIMAALGGTVAGRSAAMAKAIWGFQQTVISKTISLGITSFVSEVQ